MNKFQVFIEYKIKEDCIQVYESRMLEVKRALDFIGIEDFKWFIASDQPNLYVEMFTVQSFLEYEKIKKWRQEEQDEVFGSILKMIIGGKEKFHCWCFERKQLEE